MHLTVNPISPRQLQLEFMNQCKCPVKPLLGALNCTLQFWLKALRTLFFILFHSGISITCLLMSRIPPTSRLEKVVDSQFLLFSILFETKTPFPHSESLYSSGFPKKGFSLINVKSLIPESSHSSGYQK